MKEPLTITRKCRGTPIRMIVIHRWVISSGRTQTLLTIWWTAGRRNVILSSGNFKRCNRRRWWRWWSGIGCKRRDWTDAGNRSRNSQILISRRRPWMKWLNLIGKRFDTGNSAWRWVWLISRMISRDRRRWRSRWGCRAKSAFCCSSGVLAFNSAGIFKISCCNSWNDNFRYMSLVFTKMCIGNDEFRYRTGSFPCSLSYKTRASARNCLIIYILFSKASSCMVLRNLLYLLTVTERFSLGFLSSS